MKQILSISGFMAVITVLAFTTLRPQPVVMAKAAVVRKTPVFCSPAFDPAKMNAANAPLFEGLGSLHYPVTTSSSRAQQYFDQGLTLIYAFNHGEAARSFKAAIRHDSTCAMAYWGLAMVWGPNYNAALDPSGLDSIHHALEQAKHYAAGTTPKEQMLIQALEKRFPQQGENDMTPYNAAYTQAMKAMYERYPADVEVTFFYADALMNEHPWDLWEKDGTPKEWTPRIQQVLEEGLARTPMHPGLNHFYIHAMEASRHPEVALTSAARLEGLLPAAGHLVHMPSHIYIRTGAYHEGVLVNEMASEADSTYIAQCKVEGAYPMLYYPHNIHFLAACAFMEGNSAKAMSAAWRVSANADKRYLDKDVTVQHYYIIPLYTMVHLGRWDEILQVPAPGESLLYPRAIWFYAQGMALAAKGQLKEAKAALSEVQQLLERKELQSMMIWEVNKISDLVHIAAYTLTGEIAAHEKNWNNSIAALKQAVAYEDGLNYMEPPDWFFSVRHTLGHVLVEAGKFDQAEQIYRQDLQTYPKNGWALKGLYNSLQGQHKTREAQAVQQQFEEAWKWADIDIESSRKF